MRFVCYIPLMGFSADLYCYILALCSVHIFLDLYFLMELKYDSLIYMEEPFVATKK